VHGVQGLLAIWNRWDTQAYQQLAQYGYHISGEFKTWFYPLFPWRVRLVAWVSGNYIVSAFIVSGVASVVAALLLRRTVELERRATHAANVPIFMLFALLAANRFWNAILTVCSLMFLAFFGSLFAWRHWAF
jgi:hypothetical protein